jgi:hypothetical protein
MRRLGKGICALAIVIAASLGGIAAANVVSGAPPDELTAPDPTPVAGTESIENGAPDPAGGARWAVRVYKIVNGQTCADFGRELNGELGMIDGAGAFHVRRPEDAGGNCGDPDAATGLLLAATYYPDDPTTDVYEAPRTIVHGVAGSRVTAIAVAWPDATKRLDLSPRRAFISVYPGGVADVAVSVTYRDGSTTSYELALDPR